MARGIEEFNEHTLGLPGWTNPLRLGIDFVYAPREVSFMTWMGDQDPTWNGMRVAWRNFKKSAQAGYLNPGFDIFGYRSGKPDKLVFVRWAQWGAFAPFMENGGIAEHRPWKYDQEVVEIYRRFAVWHEELGWYLYSLAKDRFLAGKSLVEIIGEGYLLGDSIYVKPIRSPKSEVKITLPQGKWRYWFDLNERYEGEKSFVKNFSLGEFPVFVKEGSLIPLWVSSSYGGHQVNENFTEQDTFWLIAGKKTGKRRLIYPDGSEALVSWIRSCEGITISANGIKKPVVVLIEQVKENLASIKQFGVEIKKSSCSQLSPAQKISYCQKEDKLFVLLSPKQGKIDLSISFAQ